MHVLYEWKCYWSITKGGAIPNQVGWKIDVKFWIKIQIIPVAALPCWKYVSIITKLPILNVIYFIVLICDVKNFDTHHHQILHVVGPVTIWCNEIYSLELVISKGTILFVNDQHILRHAFEECPSRNACKI